MTSGTPGSAASGDSSERAQPLDVGEREQIAREWLLPWIEAHKGGPGSLRGAVVVEFGCGPGAYTVPLAERGSHVIGVDIDEDEVATARRRLSAAGSPPVALHGGPFEELLEFVRSSTTSNGADLFLLAATLEHMTIHERLTVLRLAREILRPDGLLVIWETPNRLLWSDYHTSGEPFFHQLPDELALGWLDRVPREELREAVREGGALQLWRWGRGASYHELELGFGDLSGRIVAGGYDPATIDLRQVDRDELALARYLERRLPNVHPAFSRYWLDLIIRNEPQTQPAPVWRPWSFDTNESGAVGQSVWGLLHFNQADSWLRIRPGEPVRSLLVGAEPTEKLHLTAWDGNACIGQAELDPSDRSVYEVVDLQTPASELVLHVDAPVAVSFIATKAA